MGVSGDKVMGLGLGLRLGVRVRVRSANDCCRAGVQSNLGLGLFYWNLELNPLPHKSHCGSPGLQ